VLKKLEKSSREVFLHFVHVFEKDSKSFKNWENQGKNGGVLNSLTS